MKQEQQEYHETRVFFSLIERVGSWNKYQFGLFCLFSLISIMESALAFVPPYLFHQSSYQCLEMYGEACDSFVCSLPPVERIIYLPPSQFHSLADDLSQDFRCQQPEILTLLTSLVFIAGMIGMMIFSTFSERFGRKQSLMAASCLIFLGLSITIISGFFKSIWIVILAIMITYWGTQMAYQSIYCFSAEVVREQERVLFVNGLNSTYGIGIMVDAIGFYFIKDWTIIYACVFGIPALLILLGAFFFVEKPPISLLASENQQKILESLNRIAKFNNVKSTLSLVQITDLKQKYFSILKKQKQTSFTFIDLFRYDSLRNQLIPLMFLNFIILYMYFAPSAAPITTTQNILKKGLIEGSSASLAAFITFCLLSNIRRRLAAFMLIFLTFSFQLFLLFQQDDKDQVYLASYFIFRLLLSILFNAIYIVNYETFPTQVRATGSSFVCVFSMLAVIIQPHINVFQQKIHLKPMVTFAIITLIALIPNYFVKQTYHIPPPQIIEELDGNQQSLPREN